MWRRNTLCLLVVCGMSVCSFAPPAAGQEISGLAEGIIEAPPKKPQSARELAAMRLYYDQTVWSDEVLAQKHEHAIVRLWDQLLQQKDKFAVLANTEFERLIVGTEPRVRELDWGIELTTYSGSRTIPFADWAGVLKAYQEQGYKIIETEWHHSEFRPPADGRPASSVVAMVLHVTNEQHDMRYIVRGDLEITWTAERRGTPPVYGAVEVDASNVRVYARRGTPAYEQVRVETFPIDAEGKGYPNTIHPVMLQDLNGDFLPEVVVAGYNRVYWNRGNWEFEAAELCAHPSHLVNAGAIADFTGDGVLDLLVGLKNGFPQLYVGEPGGRFPSPPRELDFTDQRFRVPVSIAVGDIDQDGDLDVFIGQNKTGYQTGEIPTPYYDANDSFPSYLLINDGHGHFTDVTEEAGLGEKDRRRNFASSLVDLDDDGDLDLLLTNDFCGNDLFLNDGRGHFTDASDTLRPRSFSHGMSHTFGDYNLDGRLDFIAIGMSSTTARRLDKLGLGREEFPEHNEHRKYMGYGNRMFLRTGDGFVQAPFNDTVARTGWSWGSTTLDFDRDGDQDIYVVNGQTSGKTTMDYCTRYWCHDLYYRSDDRPDEAIKEYFSRLAPIFSGNAISWNGYEHNALLMNLDGKEFVNVGFLMNCGSEFDSRTALSGDLDLDGKVDLIYEHAVLSISTSNLIFLRNRWEDDHHWLGVHLDSTSADPSPMGAKVSVTLADGRKLLQHNVSGHSVWAQHANTVHFGLGRNDQVSQLEVIWPDGRKSTLEAPEIDRYVAVSPPASPTGISAASGAEAGQ